MFVRYGRFIAANRRRVALAALATLVLAIVGLVTVAPSLDSEGFISEDAESAQVAETLGSEFDTGGPTLILMFDADRPVSDPTVKPAVEAALAPVADEPQIVGVLTTWSTGSPALVSTDGTATYAVAVVDPDEDLDSDTIDRIDAAVGDIAATNGLDLSLGGTAAIGPTITSGVADGLVRAETVSVPLTILIQILVFGSLLAAGVPLLIGLIAIVASVAVVFVLSTDTFQSVFTINIITMLGLGLGIDYSLFMVSRFREELGARTVADALSVTMATVGKAILFSGITVIFGLAATQFFALDALQSMGQAGMIVTAITLLYGLTLLPAILAMLGPRINAVPIRRRRAGTSTESAFWHRVASFVMASPVKVLIPVLILLLVAGIPILRLDLTPGGPEVLPEATDARQVFDRLTRDFGAGNDEPIQVLVQVANGEPTSAASIQELTNLQAGFRALQGVIGVTSFLDPSGTGDVNFDWSTWSGDPARLPAPVATAIQREVHGDLVHFEIDNTAKGSDLDDLVRDVRAMSTSELQLEVGGIGAESVDTIDGITSGIVPAAIFVIVGSYLILLVTFGSVFLPLKAMFMTLLSISASLGTVVWIFQDGNFQSLFGFTASGEIISTTPILMFCILFGLSMDYEVLMLSRIQEEYERTGDNRQSVAFGLSHTATVITGAAAIMVVVFGGFILADIVIIKSMGFGLALAVLIDATIVRGLLVPATMRLMGRWNWWAPAGLRRGIDRLGLAHHATVPGTTTGD